MNNKIVINQHILPAASIARFCNPKNGCVQVQRVVGGASFLKNPKDKIFCVNRVWDQRAEQGYGKAIEDDFQNIADRIFCMGTRLLSDGEQEVINNFYSLWWTRANVTQHIGDEKHALKNYCSPPLTEQQRIDLELKHRIYTEIDGEVPSRFLRGALMQIGIDRFCEKYAMLKWYVCKSVGPEFIVSDNPGRNFLIPIAPRICLLANFDVAEIPAHQVRRFNTESAMDSKNYYFSRNFRNVFYN